MGVTTISEAVSAAVHDVPPFGGGVPTGTGDCGYYWLGPDPSEEWVRRQSGIPVPLAACRKGSSLYDPMGNALSWHCYDDGEEDEADNDVWATVLAWNRANLQTFGDGAGYVVTDRARVVDEMDLADDIGSARSNFRRDPAAAVAAYADAPLLVVTDAGSADPYKSVWRTWMSLLKACEAKGTPLVVTSTLGRVEFCAQFEDKVGEKRVARLNAKIRKMAMGGFVY